MKRGTKKFKYGQQALLYALWNRHGGACAVARLLKINVQGPVNWVNRKGVPPEMCQKVIKALNLPSKCIWGLNFKKISKFYKTVPFTWKQAVEQFGFPVSVEESILSLTPPLT